MFSSRTTISFAIHGLLLVTMGIEKVSGASLPPKDSSLFEFTFEQSTDAAAYSAFDPLGLDVRITPRQDGAGHCIVFSNTTPGAYCGPIIRLPLAFRRNLVLAFDYRTTIEGGEGNYLGIAFKDPEERNFWTSAEFTSEWSHVDISVGLLRASRDHSLMSIDLPLPAIHIYARTKDVGDAKSEAKMSLWLDNVRLYVTDNPPGARMGNVKRISYSNPPMFDWPRNVDNRRERLQYSMDPGFRDDMTMTVDLDCSFHTPSAPLKPATWYYRHRLENDLTAAWSETSTITFASEPHTYVAPPLPFDDLCGCPHPRLLPMVMADRAAPSAKEIADLVKQAKRECALGIPEHPGPFLGEDKDPRWPKWIDWYGEVADKTTARIGIRLEEVGRAAVLSGAPEAIRYAREMALAACTWDPDGGSAMCHGDLQAASFLRGMTWCYDASCDHMTPEERKTVRDMLIRRAGQFYGVNNPLKGDEAQNHTWSKVTVLAHVAVVLLGEHDTAREWLDNCLQLYVYRFLSCMGSQGGNHEGMLYWAYGGGMIARFTELMKLVAGIDLYTHPWLRRTCRFPLYCAPPDAYFIPFGDVGGAGPNHSWKGPYAPYGGNFERLMARRSEDPYAVWYAGLIETPEGVLARPPVDIPQSIHYRRLGWVVFNTWLMDGRDCVTLGMHSGPVITKGPAHQHADQNSFVINAYGDKLAVDGGYCDWYGSPHFRAYSVQTVAHNTLLINGEGQPWQHADGRVTAYHDSPGYGYTAGDAASDPRVYDGKLKRFDRRILFIKPHFVVIHDLVESAAEPVRCDWLLHAHTSDPFPIDQTNQGFEIRRKTAVLHGRLLAPEGIHMAVGKSCDVSPQHGRNSLELDPATLQPEWTLTAGMREKQDCTEFLAAMEISRLCGEAPGPAADIVRLDTPNAIGVRISHPTSQHIVLCRRRDGQGTIQYGDVMGDGDVLAIETDAGGALRRAFSAQCTFVEYRGERLHHSATPRDWAMAALPQPVSHPITGAWLELNDAREPLQGWERHLPEGSRRAWWGHFDVRAQIQTKRTITLEGWLAGHPGAYPRIHVDGTALDEKQGNLHEFTRRLKNGRHFVTVWGDGDLAGIRISGTDTPAITDAAALPKTFIPGPDCIHIEAESPTREGGRQAKVWDKIGASGGKAHCAWQHEGQWAEWGFEVENAGDYELLIRHASDSDGVLRELFLDGSPLLGQDVFVRMSSTGGWCRTTDDWRYFAVAGTDGTARLPLSAGRHTLRMEFVETAGNVDLFVWRKHLGQ